MYDINYFYKESPTKAKSRQLILEKSIELFTINGIENVTMSQVSKACDITTRNLYRYYPSKEYLVVDSTYVVFYKSDYNKNYIINDELTGFQQLEKAIYNQVKTNNNHELDVEFAKYIMFFDIFIFNVSDDHPALIKYKNEYLPQIESYDYPIIKKALEKGFQDGTINVSKEDIELSNTYISQSIFSLIMRINIKEHENSKINKAILNKHIDIILNHFRRDV